MTRVLDVLLLEKHYAGIAFGSAVVMLILYVYTQVLGNLANVDVWIREVPLLHAFLLLIFGIVFGVAFAYQVYLWKQPKACTPAQKVTGTGTSGLGTLGIFLVAQCPACASLGALLLPLSAITFINQNAIAFTGLSIALLLFTLNYLGAFKKK